MGSMEKIAPRFTQKPTLKYEGADIVFHCQIEAAPSPHVTWYHGTTRLEDSERIVTRVQPGEGAVYTLTLVVHTVVAADSGTYKVEAKNEFGQMAANINLNLQGTTPDPATKYSHLTLNWWTFSALWQGFLYNMSYRNPWLGCRCFQCNRIP